MTKHKGHFHEEAVYIQKLGYFQLGHNEDTGVKFSVSIISEETNQPWNMIPLPFHQQISGFFGFSFKKNKTKTKKHSLHIQELSGLTWGGHFVLWDKTALITTTPDQFFSIYLLKIMLTLRIQCPQHTYICDVLLQTWSTLISGTTSS